jgi:hypothetical protein
MITHNHLYEEICSFENLLLAARRAERAGVSPHYLHKFTKSIISED